MEKLLVLAGGILLQWHWTASQVFLAGIAPALAAAFAIAVNGGHPRTES